MISLGSIALLCVLGIIVVYGIWAGFTAWSFLRLDVDAGTIRREILVLGAKRHEELKNLMIDNPSMGKESEGGKTLVKLTNDFSDAVKQHSSKKVVELNHNTKDYLSDTPYYEKLSSLGLDKKWNALNAKNKEIEEKMQLFPNHKVAQWLNISPGLLER